MLVIDMTRVVLVLEEGHFSVMTLVLGHIRLWNFLALEILYFSWLHIGFGFVDLFGVESAVKSFLVILSDGCGDSSGVGSCWRGCDA